MAKPFTSKICRVACLGFLAVSSIASAQLTLTSRTLAEGLKEPWGVAIHPLTGDIYVAEKGADRIVVLKGGTGRPEPALPPNWIVATNVPRWAFSPQMPKELWLSTTLRKPGPISFATNGTLVVSEQMPNGRILVFGADPKADYAIAHAMPVPWLDQEFQWRDLFVDRSGRLYIVGSDEVGSEFMKFGSALVRETDGNWWVIDFGPFADFGTFVLSEREDVMILGDRNKGSLAWWEVDRHIMLGGSPHAAGRARLASLALYPDGAFVLGLEELSGNKASLIRMDPNTGQQTVLTETLRSIGDIAIDRKRGRYLVTDPVAGRLLEFTFEPATRFNEVLMRQMVRATEGIVGMPSEAPAFLNTFFERLQAAAKEILPEDTTHAVEFNLSDIAGKMPIVAGRVRATVTVEGAEEDPIEQIEFFLLFPSKVVMTETAVSPSLSFFSAKRKSGKVEQTRPVFHGDVGVYRMSGTSYSRIATGTGGLHIPIVVCGLEQADGGIYVNLSFLGAGIYGDYYLTLFQSAREQRAKMVVKSPTAPSGTVTYEASFLEEAAIEGMDGTITREQLSNLLVSGFGSSASASRSIGWLKLGQFPAQMTVAFGDPTDLSLTSGQTGLKEIVEKKRLEMSMEAGAPIEEEEMEEVTETPPASAAETTP